MDKAIILQELCCTIQGDADVRQEWIAQIHSLELTVLSYDVVSNKVRK